jgi:transposase
MTRRETEAPPPGHFGRTCLLEESFEEGECGVGDVGPAVVEDQGMPAAFDLDVLGGFGILELLLVAAVGECPGGGGVVGARDDQQWPPVGVLDVHAGVPTQHEVGETRLKQGFSGRRDVVGVVELAGLGLVEVVGPAVLELLVGIAALTATRLNTASVDAAIIALRALVEHRDDLVKTRTQTLNRLHVLLTHLTPTGAARGLTADRAADILRQIRPREPAAKTLRSLAADLVAEIRALDRRIDKAATDIKAAVDTSGSTLTELCGIGTLNAAKILARVGTAHRFRSAAAFASYTGTAPIEASSGDVTRHRLSRAGDRQLNCCLHTMAITQIARDSPGRAYYRKKRAAGKSHREALRCLKRRLSDAVYRQLLRDATTGAGAGPAGHAGATLASSAAGSHPFTSTSDKSLTGPANRNHTTGGHDV